MQKIQTVWVFADAAERYADLISGARKLGAEKVNAIVTCSCKVDALRVSGPDAVYDLGLDEKAAVENSAESIAALLAGEGNLFLLDVTKRSKALAALVAGRLGAALVNDALAVNAGDALRVSFRTYGGLALGTAKVLSANAVVTVAPGVFTAEPAAASADLAAQPVAAQAPKAAFVVTERRAKAASAVDLTKAKRVIGIGRGIAKQEDIAQVDEFAKVFGAEVGCSRPIAEGEHWMERERYIGVSGVQVKSEVYLALGISGQIQHMVGVNDCGLIIAVNKDKNAPIFQFADYGIVGDIYKVLPELKKAFA